MFRSRTMFAAAVALSMIAGCTALDDGKSLSDSVTAEPSPAFMKRVENDPFPAAGAGGVAQAKKSTSR